MSNIPEFIPATPVDDAVLDLSHTLTPSAMRSISNAADGLSYKPKVVVLPKDYNCPDAHALALDLARSWHMNAGRTLLVVVDLKSHKVRMIGSGDLNSAGITSDYITNTLVPTCFLPQIKNGDLASAIRLSLVEVNRKSQTSSIETSTNSTNSPNSPNSPNSSSSPVATVQSGKDFAFSTDAPTPVASHEPLPWNSIFGGLLMISIGAALIWVFVQRKMNDAAFARLKEQIDTLHQTSDQLAQAADFIKAPEHPSIVHAVSDFFAQLQTLERAYEQTEKLLHSPYSAGAAKQALSKCKRYIEILIDKAESLLADTNRITGVVSSYEPNAKIDDPAHRAVASKSPPITDESSKLNKITLSSGRSIRTPSWVVQDNGNITNYDGLNAVNVYLDQRRQQDDLRVTSAVTERSYTQRQMNSGDSGYGASAAQHHSSSSSIDRRLASGSDGGGSWGKGSSSHSTSSSSSSSDGGGSWDSGSSSSSDSSDSTSSSSDGGGSW